MPDYVSEDPGKYCQAPAPGKSRFQFRRIDPDAVRRLAAAGWVRSAIVAELGCSRAGLHHLVHRLGITVPIDIVGRRCPASGFWLRNDPELTRLVEAGDSASEAAAKIGCTKNAAIGRASRLGLVWTRSPSYELPARHRIELPPLGHCMYPVGDGWCGDESAPGRSYCPEHTARVYRAPPPMMEAV